MARILIVDDDALNRELLHVYLHDTGHTITEADSGERAIELARQERPDVVLCDVVMPGLSGFDVTRALKADSADQFLPIVLLTSLSDPSSRLLGLRAGADDFLVKPIDRHELLARVSNLLALRSKDVALVQRNVDLLEMQRRRDDMAAMIVHDLKNPMSVILANLSVLQGSADRLGTDEIEALNDAITSARRMQRLLGNLLDQARLEAARLELHRFAIPVVRVIGPLISQRNFILRSRDVKAELDIPEDLKVEIDNELVVRAFENILDNAIRYTPAGGRIVVRGTLEGDEVHIRIGNSGPAIPADSRNRVFEKFGQLGPAPHGTIGLGLYFCSLVVRAHGGTIDIEETEQLPVVFHIVLPAEAIAR